MGSFRLFWLYANAHYNALIGRRIVCSAGSDKIDAFALYPMT